MAVPSWAHRGATVVCIRTASGWHNILSEGGPEFIPEYGKAYTIADIQFLAGGAAFVSLVEHPKDDQFFTLTAFAPPTYDDVEAESFRRRRVPESQAAD